MRTLSASVLLVASGLSLGFGCDRRESREPAMTPAARTQSGVERATEEIAAARCDREVRCDNVGAEEDYTSREDCMRSTWSNTYDELDDCENGVNRNELSECLAEIGESDCNAFDRFDSWVACNLDDLCNDDD